MSTISPWKQDFPIFSINAHPYLCYLDSAATCLTPKHVAEAIYHYQCFSHANSHKSLYQLSANATEIVEQARDKVATFVGAKAGEGVIFTASSTDSINLVANSFVRERLTKQSNIIIGAVEHLANLLPWQALCQQIGATLRVAPITSQGLIDVAALANLIDSDTVLIAVNHVSNVLGVINPIKQITDVAHQKNVPVLVDGAQGVRYGPVNFTDLDCDFYVFSAHKMYGATGCGVLVAKSEYIEQMSPYQLGAGIIQSVGYHESIFTDGPLKFEPGSHNVAGIVGLMEAIDYLSDITWSELTAHLDALSAYLFQQLRELPYINPMIFWPNNEFHSNRVSDVVQCPSIFSFTMADVACQDVASFLNDSEIALRSGTQCVEPYHQRLNLTASLRVSLGLYNGFEDIDKLVTNLKNLNHLFQEPELLDMNNYRQGIE
jgi:cysteine desulfurase/selenocysteine lyase